MKNKNKPISKVILARRITNYNKQLKILQRYMPNAEEKLMLAIKSDLNHSSNLKTIF